MIKRFLRAAGDLVLPRGCAVCGKRLNLEERHICLGCLADMPLTRFWERGHNPMADKFNERIQSRLMELKTVEYEPYAYAAALFFYHSEAGYRHIPYQIKYQGNREVGRFFGRMLGKKLAGRELWADADIVIPVPLHKKRLWKRGYNQAEVIAGDLAVEIGAEMRTDILVRTRQTQTQTKLGTEQKRRNVDGAFAVTDEAAAEFNGGGKAVHLLLVDDVFTTGSTLESCFNTLRKVFPPAVRISAVTLGYLER